MTYTRADDGGPEGIAVGILEQEILRYISRQPTGYMGLKDKPSGHLLHFLIGDDRLVELNREYNGRGIVFVGRAVENLLEAGRISFHEGNYVLEDLSVMKADRDGRSKSRGVGKDTRRKKEEK